MSNSSIATLKFLSEDEVRYLAKTYGTPTFVYDLNTIEKNARYFKEMPSAFGATIRYSVKANPNYYILKVMDSLGLSLDTSSEWEALRALRAGISADKILITAQELGKQTKSLIKQGVLFDASSLNQLAFYGENFPNTEASVRINPGFGSGLVNRLTSGGLHSSFGIWHEDIHEITNLAKKYHLKISRLHSHIGSSNDGKTLILTLKKLLQAAESLLDVKIINLGGGFKVQAFQEDIIPDHYKIAEECSELIKKFKEEKQREIIVEYEPGTYMMANAGSLITEINDATTTGTNGHQFLKINAGLTEIIRPSFYGARHPIVSISKGKQEINDDYLPYCVVGHCCIAGDILSPKAGNSEELSPHMLRKSAIGDYLVVERAGGYCASMSMKNFNSYPEAPEILRLGPGKYQLIRKRQTLEDIVRNEEATNANAELNI